MSKKTELILPTRCTMRLPKEEDFDQPHLVAEEKLDGSRYVLYLGGDPYGRNYGPNTLLSRGISRVDRMHVDKTLNVPHITLKNYNGLQGTVLDGEVFVKEFGVPSGIMNSHHEEAVRRQEEIGLIEFRVWDCMVFQGEDKRHLPLNQRRELLKAAVAKMDCPQVKILPQRKTGFIEWWEAVVRKGGEGLILKDINAPYGQGWAKMKKSFDVTCVVSGKKAGGGKYKDLLGSLEIAVYKDGKLTPVGFASGFSDELRIEMSENFSAYEGRAVDIFTQEFQKNRLRHPTFHRFRDDVNPDECTWKKLMEDLENNPVFRRTKNG